ncbi:MAG: PEGA domain-containing protein [Acidobacteriota bacterium]|nr:PEGA domain-containing protein [Acidobacteriota bacterium]
MSGSTEITSFPAVLGGPDSALPLPGTEKVLAYLGESGKEIFIQPADDAQVLCNGAPLAASRWLRDGDMIGLGETRFLVKKDAGKLVFSAVQKTHIPVLTPPAERPGAAPAAIQPEDFKPGALVGANRRLGGLRPGFIAGFILFLVLGIAAVYLFRAQPVSISVDPIPDSMIVDGFPVRFELGGRKMLWPGTYTLRAEKQGYYDLVQSFEVNGEEPDLFFQMEKLPGRLKIATLEGAEVLVDDVLMGNAPLEPLELTEGPYRITARAPRYREFSTDIELPGAGEVTEIELPLEPLWAPVNVRSKPDGATVLVNGKKLGKTPVKADLLEGNHRLELTRAGYKPYRARFKVTAQEELTLPVAELIPSDGNLVLNSKPEGASATVNGVFRGLTPLEVALKPGQSYAVGLTKAGYSNASQQVTIQSGKRSEVNLVLEPVMGDVKLTVWPPDAELYVDGELQEKAEGVHRLTALPHQLEIRKPGFVPWSREVTPKPDVVSALDVTLETVAAAKKAAIKDVYTNGQGHEMRLIRPGKMTMGASRREAGRRANEVLREVTLSRPFYVATKQVTNGQYAAFDKEHDSGIISGQSLALANQPAVRLEWSSAVQYCNWLSKQEGLSPFYIKRNGAWVPAQPLSNGYRLLTEAEWAWIARYPEGGDKGMKYPWGMRLPVGENSGNFADASASAVLPGVLQNYKDGHAATAPVGSFPANPLGLYDLGGNAAEWVHDFYGLRGVPGQDQDPLGPDTGSYHVIRGSSWMHSTITELRYSFRDYGKEPRPDLGFRVARYLE